MVANNTDEAGPIGGLSRQARRSSAPGHHKAIKVSPLRPPPTRVGRPRLRSLAMTRSVWPLRMEPSSIPMARRHGPLLLHVELIEILHRAREQTLHFGHRLVRHVAAQLAHMQRKALDVASVLGPSIEMFYMHATAPRTVGAPTLELQVNPPVGHREIAYPLSPLAVTAAATLPAAGTDGCFFRPPNVTTWA